MKIKVSEATSNQIDWLVAGLEHEKLRYKYGSPVFDKISKRTYETEGLKQIGVSYNPSNNWKIAGPIIEREKIEITAWGINEWRARSNWNEGYNTWVHVTMFETFGQNPLIAAMRCYVFSKMGEVVEVPDNLI